LKGLQPLKQVFLPLRGALTRVDDNTQNKSFDRKKKNDEIQGDNKN
jgi:hypothetical protein